MVSLLFQALVTQVRQNLQAPPLAHPRRDHLCQQICHYIQEQCHHAMDRDSLAEHFNLSPSHLSRTFSQYGASSLNAYIKQVRIDKAKPVLRRQRCHLQDVATQCGFSNVNYICRVFKKHIRRFGSCVNPRLEQHQNYGMSNRHRFCSESCRQQHLRSE